MKNIKRGSEKKVGKLFKRGESGKMSGKLELKGKINTKWTKIMATGCLRGNTGKLQEEEHLIFIDPWSAITILYQ
jgi:hypothetical protein